MIWFILVNDEYLKTHDRYIHGYYRWLRYALTAIRAMLDLSYLTHNDA